MLVAPYLSMKTTISLAAVVIALGLGQTSAMAEPFDLLQTFLNPAPNAAFSSFGGSIAVIGDNVLLGDRGADDYWGAAYLFDGGTGQLLHTYQNPADRRTDAFRNIGFGSSVSVVGENVLIGAGGEDYVTGGALINAAGAVYMYGSLGFRPLLHKFLNPRPTDNDVFGTRIVPVGNNILIGALIR